MRKDEQRAIPDWFDYTACSGLCVDETSDPANCGACGEACAVGGQCVDSACQCPAGTRVCGSSCLADNTEACGASCIHRVRE